MFLYRKEDLGGGWRAAIPVISLLVKFVYKDCYVFAKKIVEIALQYSIINPATTNFSIVVFKKSSII